MVTALQKKLKFHVDAIQVASLLHKLASKVGTMDRTWPDGVALNIIRSEMIYHKASIEILCEEMDEIFPAIVCEIDIPAPVSPLFVAEDNPTNKLYPIYRVAQ